MHDDFITREAKLNAAKDIVSAYLSKSKGKEEGGPVLSPDEVCDFFKKMYDTIEDTVPNKERRSVGLG